MSVAAAPSGLRSEAHEAWRIARTDPAAVRRLDAPGRPWGALTADPETAAIAELALGVAAAELHDLDAARAHLERARATALGAGLGNWAAEAEINVALVLANAGDLAGALSRLEAPPAKVPPSMATRAECQRALILQRLGRADDALEAYRRGLAAARRSGDRLSEARVLANRGLLHAYAGRFEAAFAELRRAARIQRDLGRPLGEAYVLHNIGFTAARQGDIPAALRSYERAARAMGELDVTHPGALLDYCETLLRANLVPEANDVGRRALAELERAGMETDLAEARLLQAEVALAANDLDEAERMAVLAQFAFLAQERPLWAVKARYAWLRVRWARGDRSDDTMRAAQVLAQDLRRAGWAASATHARILAARIALERGQDELAETELRAAARHRRRAPAEIRIEAWQAEAILRWSRGNTRGAQSALLAGMRALSGYRAALGATELRVNAGAHARELGRLAIQMAIECGEAERVLVWAERTRAATVRLLPVRPPADEELAARLAELRALNQQLEETATEGGDTGGLLRTKAALEDGIRQKTWHATGFDTHQPGPPPLADLRRCLEARVLVEYVESGGTLHAVTMRDGRTRLWRVGDHAAIEREVDALRFALNRLVSARGAPGSEAVMADAFFRAARRLDESLFGPLRRTIGDRAVVVVPTGTLHALPWAALPSCRTRPVSVCPSAATWLTAQSSPDLATRGGTVLAAGPGVPYARAELDELAGIYPQARRLDGPSATARAVTGALDGAELAHVVAHGSFRADNPLFSSLRMSDGPLTVYELERLSQAPRRVVLSSCNAGLAAVRPDDELLGLSAAFFALGTATLVASTLLVGDEQTRRLMVDLHRILARGVDAPSALAEAQAKIEPADVRAFASASSFVCLGA